MGYNDTVIQIVQDMMSFVFVTLTLQLIVFLVVVSDVRDKGGTFNNHHHQ